MNAFAHMTGESFDNTKQSVDWRPPARSLLLRIFINDDDEFRCGWRALIFMACWVLIVLVANGVLEGVLTLVAPPVGRALYGLSPSGAGGQYTPAVLLLAGFGSFMDLCGAVVASAVCARYLEHRGLASIGFKLHHGYASQLAIGVAVGAIALAVTVGLEVIAGSAGFSTQQHTAGQDMIAFTGLAAMLGLAAAFEELFFRGFAFQALVHNLGPVVALAIASVAFGLAHAFNPDATVLSTINTILAGLWLGIAYLKTRSLWLCTGLHWSWNFVMVFVFGLPVSGLITFMGSGILEVQSRHPVWISGGDYGPEGGLAATVVLLLSTIAIWRSRRLKAAPEMLDAIKHGKPEPRFISLSLNDKR